MTSIAKFELVINLKTGKALGLHLPAVAVPARGSGPRLVNRRAFVTGLGAMLAAPLAAEAQQPSFSRITTPAAPILTRPLRTGIDLANQKATRMKRLHRARKAYVRRIVASVIAWISAPEYRRASASWALIRSRRVPLFEKLHLGFCVRGRAVNRTVEATGARLRIRKEIVRPHPGDSRAVQSAGRGGARGARQPDRDVFRTRNDLGLCISLVARRNDLRGVIRYPEECDC